MTTVQSPENISARRGLGWDIDSGYSGPRGKVFPLGSYGHTGWTGTSLWIDPFSQSLVIFLSNRNHPDESGNVGALRSKLGTLAGEAIADFNFVGVAGTLAPKGEEELSARTLPRTEASRNQLHTLNGIDVLKRDNFAPLKKLRIGLVTNHTGHDSERNPTIDLLRNAPGVELKVLFSPEHGIRGVMDEKVGNSVDEKTGLPVYSLYGEIRKPTDEQLKDLDALVYDIQNNNNRKKTKTATLGLTIEAAGEHGLKNFVLERAKQKTGTMNKNPKQKGKGSFV